MKKFMIKVSLHNKTMMAEKKKNFFGFYRDQCIAVQVKKITTTKRRWIHLKQEKSLEEQPKDDKIRLENFTLSELRGMKEDVVEIYGEGAFAKFVGKEILSLFGMARKPDIKGMLFRRSR